MSKKRAGRPKTDRVPRNLRLDRELSWRIDELSKKHEMSYSDLINELVSQALDGRRRPLRGSRFTVASNT